MDKTQWDAHIAAFTQRGYTTLALDLRGHGESDPADGMLSDILTDPNQAPLDVRAALEYLQGLPEIDDARIAVVGTSVGANLAVVAAAQGVGVAATVAVSARLSAIEALLDGTAVTVGPVLCYAGQTDGAGAQAETCTNLEAASAGPAQSIILEGSAAHGVSIINDFPDTIPAIVEFLDTTMPAV